MKTTIYDIARQAGVSAMTVSRVLNGKDSAIAISETTREKVTAIANKLNYVPDFMARSLRNGRSCLIGVLVPNVTFSYLPEVIEGIESVLRKDNSSVLLCTSEMDADKEIEYIELLAAKKVDGLIIWPSATVTRLQKHLEQFVKSRSPVVCIYRKLALPELRSVSVDKYAGAYEAIRHLLAKGHRRIACRKLPEDICDINPMISGYRKALEDGGIEFEPELQKPMGNFKETYQSVTELLRSMHPPTAVYTTGDYQAFGAINAARDCRVRVPKDMAVVGNNDIEFAAMSSPPLTTVAVPKREVGELAAKMVIDAVNGKEIDNHELKPKLIVRSST